MRASFICVGCLACEHQQVRRHYEGLTRPYLDLEVFEAPGSSLAAGERQAWAKEGTALLFPFRAC